MQSHKPICILHIACYRCKQLRYSFYRIMHDWRYVTDYPNHLHESTNFVLKKIYLINHHYKQRGNISSLFSCNPSAFASELQEYIENYLLRYYMHGNVISMFKSSTTHWYVTRRERFKHFFTRQQCPGYNISL